MTSVSALSTVHIDQSEHMHPIVPSGACSGLVGPRPRLLGGGGPGTRLGKA